MPWIRSGDSQTGRHPTWAALARGLVARTARRFYGGLAEFFRRRSTFAGQYTIGYVLDGIYRRGEFYLRWMQQISSLAFGTRSGRLFMRFAAIPFGGAFMVLAFLEHVLKDWIGWKDVDVRSDGTVLLFGAFLCGLINFAPFRHGVWRVLLDLYRGWRVVLVDLPLRFLRQPWMQRILKSPPVVLGFRFVVKPAALTLAVCWALPLETLNRTAVREMGMTIFLAVNLLLNSRLGRHVEEVLVDWVVQVWHRFGIRVLIGVPFPGCRVLSESSSRRSNGSCTRSMSGSGSRAARAVSRWWPKPFSAWHGLRCTRSVLPSTC